MAIVVLVPRPLAAAVVTETRSAIGSAPVRLSSATDIQFWAVPVVEVDFGVADVVDSIGVAVGHPATTASGL